MTRLVSTFISISCALSALSAVLTPDEALQRVKGMNYTKSIRMSVQKEKCRLIDTREAAGEAAVYVFSDSSDNSFLILSADDNICPLLGYGPGNILHKQDIPPHMQWWLDEYAAQIKWLRENTDNQSVRKQSPKHDRIPISPLLKTQWNQDDPYNYLCPTAHNTDYIHCPTGCGATAMAQVMKYHRYSNKSFDWDNMLDTYTGTIYSGNYSDTNRKAVATLMQECGTASSTSYQWNASSTSSTNMMKGLANLGYDKYIANPYMNDFNVKDWEQMIYEQLQKYGPVIVTGNHSRTGHAFVCDGYDGNGYYHINWGWGGKSDGYYLLTALDPDEQGTGGSAGGYNTGVRAIVNICPETKNIQPDFFLTLDSWKTDVDEISIGEEFTIKSKVYNRNYSTFQGEIAYRLIPTESCLEWIQIIQNPASIYGESHLFTALTTTIPEEVPDGNYRMYLLYRTSADEDWHDIDAGCYDLPYLNVRVEEGKAYFAKGKGADLSLEITTFATPFFPGCRFRLNVSASNYGVCDFNTGIHALIRNEDNTSRYSCTYTDLLLTSGENKNFEYTASVASNITPGTYYLEFTDIYGETISQAYPIEIQEKPDTGQSDIEVISEGTAFIGDPENADKHNINITVNTKAVGGYYIGRIYALFVERGSYEPKRLYGDDVYIPENESSINRIKGSVPALEKGKTYTVELYADQNNRSKKIVDNLATITIGDNTSTALDNVKAGREIASVRYYTPSGTRIASRHVVPGICIERVTYTDGSVTTRKRLIR